MYTESSNEIAGTSRSCLTQKVYTKSRLYWDQILIGGRELVLKLKVRRGPRDSIDHLVRFIFAKRNFQTLFWGSKSVRVDEEKVILPSVTLNKNC